MNGEGMPLEIQIELARRFSLTGDAIADYARSICPVDTGYLQSTIATLKVDQRGCEVGTDCFYAWFVENGTDHPEVEGVHKAFKIAAQPYLRPAQFAVGPQLQAIWGS